MMSWNKPPKWFEEMQKEARAFAESCEPSESFKKMVEAQKKEQKRRAAIYKDMEPPQSFKKLLATFRREQEQAERALKPIRDMGNRHKDREEALAGMMRKADDEIASSRQKKIKQFVKDKVTINFSGMSSNGLDDLVKLIEEKVTDEINRALGQ